MVHVPPFILITYLLAASKNGRIATRNGRGGGRGGRSTGKESGRGGRVGRSRYTSAGTKKKKKTTTTGDTEKKKEHVNPLPSLTETNGEKPFYFTCRHTYENILLDEVNRYAKKSGGEILATSPYPGLVRVEDKDGVLPTFYDPVYALQTMPQCIVVSAESIKGIANEIMNSLLGGDAESVDDDDEAIRLRRESFRRAPKGSLTIHALVPGMCKGQTKPVMQHRCEKAGEEVMKMMKKVYPAARRAPIDENGNRIEPKERWILQMMLQSPNIAVASLIECRFIGPGQNAYWPNTAFPVGLAKVDIEEKMPSSAYRKLMEGLECMGRRPNLDDVVVDLGASPGGWTQVMRRLGCYVISVDRSELDPVLMNDDMVEFIKGDAFVFSPPVDENRNCWMISDIIAYPKRCTELLNKWTGEKLASHMIVTMKFQGDEPDLDELDNAIETVQRHGYACRVKHFFNNKNEVTFMVSENSRTSRDLGTLGSKMYPVVL